MFFEHLLFSLPDEGHPLMVANEALEGSRDPKKCKHPGGDHYWEGGTTQGIVLSGLSCLRAHILSLLPFESKSNLAIIDKMQWVPS